VHKQIYKMNLIAKKSIIKVVDDAYVLWLENENRFVWLEEPAYFVVKNHLNGLDRISISKACMSLFQANETESLMFVDDILNGIDVNEKSNDPEKTDLTNIVVNDVAIFSAHNYSINGKILCFRYQTKLFEHYLHPLLQHLETEEESDNQVIFELLEHNKKVVLRVDNQIRGAWGEDEIHLLKGMAFLNIINIAYEKNDDDWMAMIHASAVTNGKKTIVFTASPGSGKSTIAALLQQHGYALLSDDFVPIERYSQKAFPFPVAMSVKHGAKKMLSALYPSLANEINDHHTYNQKTVSYLTFNNEASPVPAQEVIFIKYNPDVDFEIEELPRAKALKMLLDETWTNPSPENAGSFLDWFLGLKCYRLTYSNNEKAISKITQLFTK
jgi:hypothetical protein